MEHKELAGVLVTLRARVDAHFAAAVTATPTAFACRAGCESCCHQRFGVFEVEAAPIRAALRALATTSPARRERVRHQADDPADASRCALLVHGRCAVYEARPLICRTHGLPVAVPSAQDNAKMRVDHCPLNFRDQTPPRASILALAAINEPLAVLAALWSPSSPRIKLADLARAGADDDCLNKSKETLDETEPRK
jgi:Fe-S-cluster containining protein